MEISCRAFQYLSVKPATGAIATIKLRLFYPLYIADIQLVVSSEPSTVMARKSNRLNRLKTAVRAGHDNSPG